MDKYNILNYFKPQKGDVIVVGASSGPDSMALLKMLLKIRDEYELKIVCCHVNHNVRKQSIEEEEYMKNYSKDNKLIFETMTITEYGDDNFENEARNIRYHFFEEIVEKYNAKYLMTAHHGDDLIETILMRIVRGSNLNGYSGFKDYIDMGNYYLVRPLINFTKEELVNYDELENVKYYIDSSNSNTNYTRNRYRKVILPFLKKEDENVHKKFIKFSNLLQETNTFVNRVRDKELKKVFKNGKLLIDKYLEVDDFIQKEILYFLMQEYYQDDLILINDKHIDLIYNTIIGKKSNVRLDLPNGVVGIKSYNEFYLTLETDELTEYEIELSDYAILPNGHNIKHVKDEDNNSNFICRLSSEEVMLPLTVRTRKIGDKITLKGNGGTKKIKDIFINEKINVNDRDLWPIVTDSLGRVVWIPGLKKSKFDKKKTEKYDIILKYE